MKTMETDEGSSIIKKLGVQRDWLTKALSRQVQYLVAYCDLTELVYTYTDSTTVRDTAMYKRWYRVFNHQDDDFQKEARASKADKALTIHKARAAKTSLHHDLSGRKPHPHSPLVKFVQCLPFSSKLFALSATVTLLILVSQPYILLSLALFLFLMKVLQPWL
jgi:hypothetical protein